MYKKPKRNSTRNYLCPLYKKWRNDIYRRDRWKCQMPNCGCKNEKINAHHIRPWADYPLLRYDINNGITLCKKAHDKIKGQEMYYIKLFMGIILRK